MVAIGTVNPTTIITEATAWLGAAGTLVYLFVKFFGTILPAIAEFRADITQIKGTQLVHANAINAIARTSTASVDNLPGSTLAPMVRVPVPPETPAGTATLPQSPYAASAAIAQSQKAGSSLDFSAPAAPPAQPIIPKQ